MVIVEHAFANILRQIDFSSFSLVKNSLNASLNKNYSFLTFVLNTSLRPNISIVVNTKITQPTVSKMKSMLLYT